MERPHAEPQSHRAAVNPIADMNRLSGRVVNCAYRIHSGLGPGLLESVYELLLVRLLEREGIKVERQKSVSFEFEGMRFENAFRVDLLVEGTIVVELKSQEKDAKVHAKQLLTYLKVMDLQLGLLINFGAPYLTDGIRRVANGL
jgi:GxxExxY protein